MYWHKAKIKYRKCYDIVTLTYFEGLCGRAFSTLSFQMQMTVVYPWSFLIPKKRPNNGAPAVKEL